MEYCMERFELSMMDLEKEYRLLSEGAQNSNNVDQKEIASKQDNILKRAWAKIKALLHRIKNFFTKKDAKNKINKLANSKDQCQIKIPEGETPKSFNAKLELIKRKLKAKQLSEKEVDDIRHKMAKGIMVVTGATLAAGIGKTLIDSISVCDELADEYDHHRSSEYQRKKEEQQKKRISHLDKQREKNNSTETAIPHAVSAVIALAQDGLGHILNAVDNLDKGSTNKYKDLRFDQRARANKEIKDNAKVKVAAAKDIMDTCKDKMDHLESINKKDSSSYKDIEEKYNKAKEDYYKYINVKKHNK